MSLDLSHGDVSLVSGHRMGVLILTGFVFRVQQSTDTFSPVLQCFTAVHSFGVLPHTTVVMLHKLRCANQVL